MSSPFAQSATSHERGWIAFIRGSDRVSLKRETGELGPHSFSFLTQPNEDLILRLFHKYSGNVGSIDADAMPFLTDAPFKGIAQHGALWQELLKYADFDGDGRITYHEFVDGFVHNAMKSGMPEVPSKAGTEQLNSFFGALNDRIRVQIQTHIDIIDKQSPVSFSWINDVTACHRVHI